MIYSQTPPSPPKGVVYADSTEITLQRNFKVLNEMVSLLSDEESAVCAAAGNE